MSSAVGMQDARAVAYRALSLGALLTRSDLEISFQHLEAYDLPAHLEERLGLRHKQRNQALEQWLNTEEIRPHLSQSERQLLAKPFGTWTDLNLIHASWRVEALGSMLWALGHLEAIPEFDTQFEVEDVLRPLDVLTPVIDFVWLAQLRPAQDLYEMRDRAELWNWRSRALELERMGVRPANGLRFAEIVRQTAEKAHELGHLPVLIEGDFPAFGRPYCGLSPSQQRLIGAIASERYQALSWLCEMSVEWENLPVDR